MEEYNTMDHKIILKCRLCLDEFEEGKMFDLFVKENVENEDILLTLHEKVEYCCGVRIRESAEMPSKICTKCNEMTKIWFNFRQMCINSQVYLESLCKERSTLIKSNKGNYLEYVVEDLQTFRSQARQSNNALTIKLEALVEGDDMDDIDDILDDEGHDIIENRVIINEDDNDAIDDELDHDYNTCKDSESYTDDKLLHKLKADDTQDVDFTNMATDRIISSTKTVRSSKTIPKKSNVTIKKAHKIPTPTSYMCSICGNVYTKKNSFKYHMSLHSDIKPHECELCGKSFRHVSELKSHMRRHTGEKPYKCSYCERHFVDRSERHRHERVHTNTRPYACNICGKRFTYSVILKNHLKYHSGVKDFNCLVCDKSFTLPHQLKAHLQTLTHKQKEEQFVAPYDVVYDDIPNPVDGLNIYSEYYDSTEFPHCDINRIVHVYYIFVSSFRSTPHKFKTKMSKAINYMTMSVVDPQERIRHLSSFGNIIQMDPNLPVTRYYRSGAEMLRMAQVYMNEGHHENAFILYMKYMTLFIEKIRTHPDYNSIKTEMKGINKRLKEEIIPTTEKLRAKLLDRYQKDYEQFLANKEAEKARELERAREEQKQRNKGSSSSNLIPVSLHVQIDPNVQPSAPDMSLLDQVVYPNDFPGANRSTLRSSGLLLSGDAELDKSADSSVKPPTFDRTQKPNFSRSDSLLAGSLRNVIIPQNTMETFLQLAQKNTQNNIETCGILAGYLAHNKLFISHVIIPKQHGSADSCTTMNEEEIFDVQDQQNLITLGWIHTHPSQTAFLSSVDLHTHCSYQIMMPEAIAIVCAPKYQSTGFFILTPNYGLDYIAQCRQASFHPHPNNPPLFMDAQHIQMDSNTKIHVVDLRR